MKIFNTESAANQNHFHIMSKGCGCCVVFFKLPNMQAETTESNQQSDRFASLTDSDLNKLAAA